MEQSHHNIIMARHLINIGFALLVAAGATGASENTRADLEPSERAEIPCVRIS